MIDRGNIRNVVPEETSLSIYGIVDGYDAVQVAHEWIDIRKVVPDLAMSIYGIVDGYGYDADQVAEEWINILHSFDEILEAFKKDGLKYGCIDLLSVDGFINVTFE